MNLTDLFTIFALMLGVYAILPNHKVRDISLRIAWYDWLIASCSLVVVMYLQYYDVFVTLNFTPQFGLSRWSLNPKNVSFLVVLITTIVLCVSLSTKSLPLSNLKKFERAIRELSYRGEWKQIVVLIGIHIDKLVKIYDRCRPTTCIHSRDFSNLGFLEETNSTSYTNKTEKLLKSARRMVTENRMVNRFRYAQEKRKETLDNLFDTTLYRDEFAVELTKCSPCSAVKILKLDIPRKKEFCHLYLKHLFSDVSSSLHCELQNNQCMSGRKYEIPDSNVLLSYLFCDITIAEKLWAWKPIGETVISRLLFLHRNPCEDDYNLSYDDLTYVKSECIIYNAIHYFRVMVTQALYQGVKWHMWLYYLEHFTRYICRNYDLDDPDVDVEAEIPTRYSDLLYEILSTLQEWIRAVIELSPGRKVELTPNSSLGTENGNIIKCSMLALGKSIHHIVSNDKVPEKFKRYRIDSIWQTYFDIRLPGHELDDKYAETFLESLLNAGSSYYKGNKDYNGLVLDVLLHIDRAVINHDHLVEALTRTVNHYIDKYETDSKYIEFSSSQPDRVMVKSKLLQQGRFERTIEVDRNG